MSRSVCNRADLVRVMSAQDSLVPFAAEMLGYSKIVRAQVEAESQVDIETQTAAQSSLGSSGSAPVHETTDWPDSQLPAFFWQAYRYEQREPLPEDIPEDGELVWRDRPAEGPRWYPISDWRSLVPRLRAELSETSRSSRVDVDKVVRMLAAGELVHDVPRQIMRRWGDRVQIVVDRSEHLIPYRKDQAYFLKSLEKLLPRAAVQIASFDETRQTLKLLNKSGRTRSYQFPSAGVPIVVLSDLGALCPSASQGFWQNWVADLVQRDGHALAVVPCAPERIMQPIRAAIQVIPWQKLPLARSCTDETKRRQLVDRLFQMLSPAERIEPGLLRAVRRTIEQAGDASLESEFWQDPRLDSPHPTAASLRRDAEQPDLLPDFQELPLDDRRGVLELLRRWRQPLDPEIWIREIWGLDSQSAKLLPKLDREDADRWQAALLARTDGEAKDALLAWLARATAGLPDRALREQRRLRELHRRTHQHDDLLGGDPRELGQGDSAFQVTVGQSGSSLVFSNDSEAAGEPKFHTLGSVETTNGSLAIEVKTEYSKASFWKDGEPPKWATDWGWDEYGAYCDFSVTTVWPPRHLPKPKKKITVTQRMRWIPPGRFLMGSAEEEEGRWYGEGPQHEVTISHGFWMFDTPVTQELWQAVMGTNRSHFKGKRWPVENVSWDDAQEFLKRLNDILGDIVFSLPTEAQWEYACRAETTTRYAFGDELSEGQARFATGKGTSAVGSYDPNDWGLYDMHGNVAEWCHDWDGNYTAEPQVNPQGPTEGHDRVLRGGSWGYYAQGVRSASRGHAGPGNRTYNFGFRCAQVQGAAEPTREDGEAAEPQDYPTSGGEAAALKIDSGAPRQLTIPAAPAVIIHSDVDSLQLRRITRPTWADSIGRDRYGLWTEFTVEDGGGQETRVVQRMRWIPPGRFLMGSPEDDEMAFDREKPRHDVVLSHGFWLFDTPVTQQLWSAVMESNPSAFQGPLRPVETVSWDDCQQFLDRINQRIEGLDLSLPTEAEWEFACRAGSTTRYAFGEEITKDQANFWQEPEKNESSDVKTFAPNHWGLFDMHGNVLEWCHDWYGKYTADPQVNPLGPSEGHDRVLRGGAWSNGARSVRSAYRLSDEPGSRDYYIGFRCAQVQLASRKDASEMSEGLGQSTGGDAKP